MMIDSHAYSIPHPCVIDTLPNMRKLASWTCKSPTMPSISISNTFAWIYIYIYTYMCVCGAIASIIYIQPNYSESLALPLILLLWRGGKEDRVEDACGKEHGCIVMTHDK
jgi:hypothetical protein